MTTRISLDQVNAMRLDRHHLSERAPGRELARTISDVCGIQAQVLSAAELAIRCRVEGVNQEDVRGALWKTHSVVRTWCMRGTLHLLAASDLPLYVSVLRSKMQETERWLREVAGVPTSEVAAVTDGIREALSERALTREELSREVERRRRLRPRTRIHLRSAWGILLRPAAYQGHLAFGESLGQKAVFVEPARWVKPWNEPPRKDAVMELFRRYVRAYGPVTVSDFGRWWGGLEDDDKSLLQGSAGELEQVDLNGFKGLMLKRDTEIAAGLEPPRGVQLLPSFDCYPMFYAPREFFVPQAHRSRIFRQTAGWNYPSLVVGGLAAGIWGLKKRRGSVEVEVEPFRPLTSTEKKGVQEEGADIARFLGTAAEIRYQPVSRT